MAIREAEIYRRKPVGKGVARGLTRAGKWAWNAIKRLDQQAQANERRARVRRRASEYRAGRRDGQEERYQD